MSELYKIAEINTSERKRLRELTKILKDKGYNIVFDEEYDNTAYVCISNEEYSEDEF